MAQIDTLFEFLETGGLDPRCFDMGRRILPLPRETFLGFERTALPYPQPLQQQAWLALVLQTGDDLNRQDPLIWFIRFPLDEQGKLLQAARDDFMFQLMERLGEAAARSEAQRTQFETVLEDNPYAFQPKQEHLATLHARLTLDLQHPPSHFYDHARRYFNGELGWDQWSFIGYQGIADVAARHALEGNDRRLAAAIPHLPPPPLEALCQSLEHTQIPPLLSEALLLRAKETLKTTDPDPQVITGVLRGISFSASERHRKALLTEVLQHVIARRHDVLAAIAGRLWQDLNDATLRGQFLEQLAANDRGQAFFDSLLSDLLYLGECRPGLLQSLRNPHRSGRLSKTIGAFFSHIKEP